MLRFETDWTCDEAYGTVCEYREDRDAYPEDQKENEDSLLRQVRHMGNVFSKVADNREEGINLFRAYLYRIAHDLPELEELLKKEVMDWEKD